MPTLAPARRLSLVPSVVDAPQAPVDEPVDEPVMVPVPRTSEAAKAAPWRTQGDVAFVPAVLLLAASGRCSCDDCCAVLVRQQAHRRVSAV